MPAIKAHNTLYTKAVIKKQETVTPNMKVYNYIWLNTAVKHVNDFKVCYLLDYFHSTG